MAGIARKTQYKGNVMEDRNIIGKPTRLSIMFITVRNRKFRSFAYALSNLMEHLVYNCRRFGASNYSTNDFRNHFQEWMSRQWRNIIMRKIWCSAFFAVAWSLWLMRNEIIFQQKALNVEILCNLIRGGSFFGQKHGRMNCHTRWMI